MRVIWVKRLEDIYQFGESVGSGTYGVVVKAVNIENKKACVCKIVDRNGDYVRELDHLIALHKCYGVLPIKQATFTNSKLCMEFDKAECNLRTYIKKKRPSDKREGEEFLSNLLYEALTITNQLLITTSHIHANHIVHRDIKSSNVVITHDEKGVKAWTIDFGMSKRVVGTEDNKDISHYEIVTAMYRAPELWRPYRSVIEGEDQDTDEEGYEDEEYDDCDTMTNPDEMRAKLKLYNAREYNRKVDNWSIGCILFEIITGECPFDGDDEQGVRKRIAGHILNVTGKHDEVLCTEKPKSVNLEKELDNAVMKILRPNKGEGNRIEYMDLCSSMEDVTITPQSNKKQHKRYCSVGDYTVPQKCESMLFVVKSLLRGLLHPEVSKRSDSMNALSAFGRYSFKHSAILQSPINLRKHRTINTMNTENYLNVIQTLWITCDHLKYNTSVVYLGLYLWIRCITLSPQLCKEFTVSTIMLASLRMAVSYVGESTRDLKQLRQLISKHHEDATPKREINCTSSILTLLEGRIWVLNPDDLRHLRLNGCDKGKWNPEIEKTTFCVIMSMLSESFTVPDAEAVIQRVGQLIQTQNDRDDLMRSR